MTAAAEPHAATRRPRRYDPDRKGRIITAALDIISQYGVSGTTHRLIATAADVSLGSMTYYFTSLGDLLEQAFGLHAERMSVLYERHFDDVRTHADLVEAITELVHGSGAGTDRDWAIALELYLAALRDPALRTITEQWMGRSREVLQRFIDPVTAKGVDALIEGLIIHLMLSTRPGPRVDTVRYVERALGAVMVNPTPTTRTSPSAPGPKERS